MPPADRLKFKYTVVDQKLTLPPDPRPIRTEAPPVELLPPVDRRSDATLMRWTDTEVLARVPPQISVVVQEIDIPPSVDPRLVLLYARASEQARAYGLLRHRLLGLSDLRVITVASARPGDGKTTCAANLALALADETMARVLLVEANLQRPALATVFGYSPSDSLIARLTTFGEAVQPYPVAAVRDTRLHIAALPRVLTGPARLDRLLFDAALQDLRAAYDYIVIDAGAVLESTDADVAAECADGVILVARAHSSRRGALVQALDQLRPARILGTVMIDA